MEIRHSEPEMKTMSKYIAKGNENHKVQNGDDIFVSRPSSLIKKTAWLITFKCGETLQQN